MLLAASLLLATFMVAVVVEYVVFIAVRRWPTAAELWIGYGILYGPRITMLVPGVAYLLRRRWVTATVLIAVGWVLGLVAMFIAGGAVWAKYGDIGQY